MLLFPFAEYWWFYVAFTAFVFVVLALDLGVFHREAHEVGFREALTWSVVWVVLALLFGWCFYSYAAWKFPQDPRLMALPGFDPSAAAWQSGLEYLTGYIIEKSLAVDNIFVFVVVFTFFAIPAKYQHRVLFYGIIGALFFRIIFIALGSVLMQYKWIVIIFGVFLIATGLKILFAPEKPIDPTKNPLIRLLKKFLPVTPHLEGQKFFVRKEGVLFATPLFVALCFIEVSDIIFAVDSVPAIFAITTDTFVVYTSNIMAVLGLRALYFALSAMIDRFHYLKHALAAVLIFIGSKIFVSDFLLDEGKFPPVASLAVTFGLIAAGIAWSLWKTRDGAAHR